MPNILFTAQSESVSGTKNTVSVFRFFSPSGSQSSQSESGTQNKALEYHWIKDELLLTGRIIISDALQVFSKSDFPVFVIQ